MKTLPITKLLVYLLDGSVKRIELHGDAPEAFYKEEVLNRPGEDPLLLVDCFFAGAAITDVPTGK